MLAFFVDFFTFLWDSRHWMWRLLACGVIIGGLSVVFRMIDAEDAKRVDMRTVSIGELKTIDMFYGEINVPVNYVANEASGFVDRPYKLVLYRGEGRDLILTGVTPENEIWRMTVKVAGDGQTVGLTQATRGEGNTSFDVFLGPQYDGSNAKAVLLVFGLMGMIASFLVFRR